VPVSNFRFKNVATLRGVTSGGIFSGGLSAGGLFYGI